jgi:hypothetical protein
MDNMTDLEIELKKAFCCIVVSHRVFRSDIYCESVKKFLKPVAPDKTWDDFNVAGVCPNCAKIDRILETSKNKK